MHLLLIDVATPATASIFISQLMSLITLQLVDMDDFFDDIFGLHVVQPLSAQFEVMGYESLYIYKNLGSVVLGIFVPFVVWALVYLFTHLL